jgi:DNA-binding NarL/FixJ family response regulator
VPAKIVIVDDHEIVREGIRTLITRSRPKWNIVGEASSGAEAIEICKTLQPDVLVLDITMPGMSGLEAALKIAESELRCRVLMFTMHESERLAAEVRQAGAQGLVLKSQAARDLIRAIECLLAGGTFFGREHDPETNIATSLPPSGSATDQSIRDCRGRTPANAFVARIRSRPFRSILVWSYRQILARGIHRTVSRWTTR